MQFDELIDFLWKFVIFLLAERLLFSYAIFSKNYTIEDGLNWKGISTRIIEAPMKIVTNIDQEIEVNILGVKIKIGGENYNGFVNLILYLSLLCLFLYYFNSLDFFQFSEFVLNFWWSLFLVLMIHFLILKVLEVSTVKTARNKETKTVLNKTWVFVSFITLFNSIVFLIFTPVFFIKHSQPWINSLLTVNGHLLQYINSLQNKMLFVKNTIFVIMYICIVVLMYLVFKRKNKKTSVPKNT